MKKFLKLTILGIVVVVVAGVFAIQTMGHVILAKALETAIGTPVKIKKLNIGHILSEVGIYDITVKNPKGFTEPVLASIPEIYVSYDLASFFKQKPHIKEIRLNLEEITVERNIHGKFNLIELTASKVPAGNTGKTTAPAPNKQPKASSSPSKPAAAPIPIKIDSVTLSLGRALYVDRTQPTPTTKTIPLEIHEKVFKDLDNPSQIAEQIVFLTIQKVGLQSLAPYLNAIPSPFEKDLAEQVEKAKGAISEFAKNFKLPFGEQSPPSK